MVANTDKKKKKAQMNGNGKEWLYVYTNVKVYRDLFSGYFHEYNTSEPLFHKLKGQSHEKSCWTMALGRWFGP